MLEPLSPLFSDKLHEAIGECEKAEIKDFTLAELIIAPGHMDEFINQLEEGASIGIPMVTSLRPIIGNRNMVIDLWKINLQVGYQPQEFFYEIGYKEEWWNNLRKMAPQERMMTIYPLPYSPLK